MNSILRSRDWAGLSDLLLDLIFHKLSSISDCLRFGIVCKSWFSFVSKNYDVLQQRVRSSSLEELPLLMICTNRKEKFVNASLYSATKRKRVFDVTLPFSDTWRCCGSSLGWLAFQNMFDLRIQLFNPFSGQTIHLPCPKYFFGKIIITKNPITNPNNYEVAAMVRDEHRCSNLAILKPGSHTWIFTHDDQYALRKGDICDMVYYNERYYVVTNYGGRVLTIDNTTLKFKEIMRHTSIIRHPSEVKFYLIKTTTDELLKVRISTLTSRVKIFKLVASESNTHGSKFEELEDLGDEALFFCDHCSMSVLASKFSRCKANSVYFLDSKLSGDMNIVHLHYDGLRSPFSIKASIDNNIPALWIIPTPKFTYILDMV